MKILVANLGSTSLKWRLFDFSNGAERLLHKGGFERVTDYPQAIEDCLAQLQGGRRHRQRKRARGGRFQDRHRARTSTGCVRLDERVLAGDGGLQRPRARAQSALHHRHPPVRATHAGGAAGRAVRDRVLPVRARGRRCATPCRKPGTTSASAAGASTARATSSSPSARAELLGRDDVAERARSLYLDGGKTPVNEPAAARHLLPPRRQFEHHRHPQRRRHRHQHGHEPAVRPAAEQPRRRSRLRRDCPTPCGRSASRSTKRERQLCQGIRAARACAACRNDIRDISAAAEQGNATRQARARRLRRQRAALDRLLLLRT